MSHFVLLGGCLELMPGFDESSVDAVVTDPPYGIDFQGREWDRQVPGPEYWAECLRVAKPGAWLAAMGGPRTYHRLACALEDAGWEIRDCLCWLYGSGMPKGPSTERAGMNGRGTCLKPAWEPIVLARKPYTGAILRNLDTYGTGALNIDDCRIPADAADFEKLQKGVDAIRARGGVMENSWANDSDLTGANPASPLGRWPANVILDEEAAAQLDAQSGDRPGMSASRFFYCPKASKSEKEAGLESLEFGTTDDGRKTAASTPHQRGKTLRKNTHPTVKPIALMQWIVELICPPGGVVLDPFCGSGSTGCAALCAGRDFIGIDLDPKSVEIAEMRIDKWS